MADGPDVIIVGGGVIGCGCAYYLARQGARVRILESQQIGRACSRGNCGLVCPSHVLPLTAPGAVRRVALKMFNPDSALYIKPRFDPQLWFWLTRFASNCNEAYMLRAATARRDMLQTSMQLYRELLALESLDVEWADEGLLFVYKTPHEFHAFAPSAELMKRDFGIEMLPYEGGRLTELEPSLRPELAGAWHCPTDAHLRPDRLMAALVPLLQSLNVEILEGVTVERFDVAGGKLRNVITSRGSMTCDQVIVAAGAETALHARTLGCRIPIQPGKGYSITLPRPARPPRVPMIFEESHVAATPWPSGIRIGSTMEFVGYDRSINRRRIDLFKRAAAEHLVDPPTGPVEEEWFGWRPMTYDELPCIGRAPRAENVIVAAGHGMLGISTMPATGKLVAELALGQTPHIDPAPYALTRFTR
jgi:D-amino-acid dehydrogenase